ncbi:MAG: 23S rRNA (pseudouridine(1915)-N(3))-methyltransferase RlmH [Rikenellaceae bacterium]
MTIDLIVVGKSNFDYVINAVDLYSGRLKKYVPFNIVTIPDVKNAKSISQSELKTKEGELLCAQFAKYDCVVLLDENGRHYTSVEFAEWINQRANRSIRRMCFVIGGAYGFSDEVYRVAHEKISLSKMTFSHQMIRILIVEQIYRAFTILNGEPYHHV